MPEQPELLQLGEYQQTLAKKKHGCQSCPLRDQKVVPPEGNLETAKLVIVGQNPGAVEVATGRPFIGPCGDLLFPMLESLTGIRRDECYITNSCKCWNIRDESTDPSPEVYSCCGNQWAEEWDSILKGKRVLLLGSWSSRRFFRTFSKQGLFRYKGESVFLELYHPAWVLYGGNREIWKKGLSQVNSLLRWPGNRTRRVLHDVIPASGLRDSVEFFTSLPEESLVAFDIETTALSPFTPTSRILCISFSDGETTHVYDWEALGGLARDAAKAILESPVRKAAQNAKFDIKWLMKEGIQTKNLYCDPMVAQFLLDGGMGASVGLNQMIMLYEPEYMGWDIPDSYKNMAEVPKDVLHHYNSVDSFTTARIAQRLSLELRRAGMWELFSSVLMPAEMALTEAEFNGMHFDVAKVVAEKERLGAILEEIARRIAGVAEQYGMVEGMNIDSLYWLRELMFEKMGITPLRRTSKKGNPSLNVEALEAYATSGLRLAQDVLEWRSLNKVKSTYYDSYVNLIEADGKIHPSFNLTVVMTGRLSCWDPNVQNVPSEVRKVFVSRFPKGSIIEADFKQIEMRVMGIVSADRRLTEVFREGRDPHAETASAVTGIPVEEILRTKHESRQDAKITNFSILYGAGVQALAQRLGDYGKAEQFFNGFFSHFSGVARWQERQWSETMRTGVVTSPLGRSWDMRFFKEEERRNRCFNFPIQSTASDITLYTFGAAVELIKHFGMKTLFIATVHDSMLFDVPEGEETRLKQILLSVVQTLPDVFPWMSIPMELDFKVGESWGG